MTFENVPPDYPRNLVGYGARPPHPRWPGGARIAVSFVLNYEEGAENCVLDGDPASETFLSEIIGAQAFPDRHLSMESLYEYGSRAGVWLQVTLRARRRGSSWLRSHAAFSSTSRPVITNSSWLR